MKFESLDLEKLRNDQSFTTQKMLFPHQVEAIEAVNKTLNFRDTTGKGGLLVLPTGAGKTFTTVKWLCESAIPMGAKVIWLAHSFHLLDQAFETFLQNAKWIPFPRSRLNVRVVSSNLSHCRSADIQNSDDVLILTTPTAISNQFREALDKAGEKLSSSFSKFLQNIKDQRLVLVLDEAHHAPAFGCRKLLQRIREIQPSAYFLGLTATPDYSDVARRGWLNNLFEQWILYEANKNKLQGQNILAREILIQKKTNEVLDVDDSLYDRLMREHKDLPEEIVEKLASSSLRNDFIVQEYLANQKEYGKTIIFADRWFQCLYLKDKLVTAGVRADAVYSHVDADLGSADARNKRTADENQKIIQKFKKNELDVLINVRMLTEGTDVPNTQTVFITRETTSSILLTQMIGRALRCEKAGGGPDKKEANIVFFTDTWRKIIHWASYSPGGGLSEEQPVKGYYPIEMISIRLVEELIKRINSGRAFQTEPFSSLVPTGWYQTTYVSLGGAEELSSFDEFVMVYNVQEKGFQNIIGKYLGNLDETWEKEDLQIDSAKSEIERMAESCFQVNEENLGKTLLSDLIRIARHMAQNRAAPKFFPFEERERYDLDKIAKNLYLMNSLDQRRGLEKTFQQPGSLWSSFYKAFDRFKSAYDGALNRFLELLDSGADSQVRIPIDEQFTPPIVRKRELSEAEKEMVFKDDHYRCRCCGAEKSRKVFLQVDHILPDRMSGDTSMENSQTLCKFCNTTKGINELNFRMRKSLLRLPEKFEAFGPANHDDFRTFLQRAVNFFYHCGAVVDVRRKKGSSPHGGMDIYLQLYPENNPQWFKPHADCIIDLLRKHFSICRAVTSLVIESDEERVQVAYSPLAEKTPEPSVIIEASLLAAAEKGDANAQVEVGKTLRPQSGLLLISLKCWKGEQCEKESLH